MNNNQPENKNIENLNDLEVFLKNIDNSENVLYLSNIPNICKNEPCLLGIDEAGRGPALGPMVYGIAYCPISKKREFEDLKCVDSKTLTESKRNDLLLTICNASDFVGWAVDINSPNKICNSMLSRQKVSLNEVALNSTIKLLENIISAGVNVTEVYVDTLGPPEKHQKTLTEYFKSKIKFSVEKKADSLFPIVSAASICAKVTRDHALKVWKFGEGFSSSHTEFGSGYPNDPLTKNYLQTNVDNVFGFPRLVRFSWSTCEKILTNSAAEVVWSDTEEENGGKAKKPKQIKTPEVKSKNAKITSFFFSKKNKDDAEDIVSPNFFTERNLTPVQNFL